MIFKNRKEAGSKLAQTLTSYAGPETVIYALPRGGAIVGAEVARILQAPLDLVVVRKVGHPYSPEFAIAAVSENGRTIENGPEVERVDSEWFTQEVRVQQEEAKRRRVLYLHGRQPIPATDKVAVIVDDGLATGLTMLLAIEEIRLQHPIKIIVAVPVAPAETVERLRSAADVVEVLHKPTVFGAIGAFYHNFDQVNDDQVIQIMNSAMTAAAH